MEMHQVKYFLAIARKLNFTRAAEECNVSQPSLTRAIKQLEDELGGELFRRERPQAQLTELGLRMLHPLKQCYDSAMEARSLASAVKRGTVGSLKIAISQSVDLSLVIPHIQQLEKHFGRLALKLWRGTGIQVAEFLKQGDVELAIAGTLEDSWERIDRWPLFVEPFVLVVQQGHKLANQGSITLDELKQERIIRHRYSESEGDILSILSTHGVDINHVDEVATEFDQTKLVELNMGIALVAESTAVGQHLTRLVLNGVELRRTVYLYGVAGRERTPVAATIMKMLRGANWRKDH